MRGAEHGGPRTLSRKKRLAFWALMAVVAWMFCEIGSYLLVWLITGSPFSWRRMQDLRQDRATRPIGQQASAFAEVHPYVGFVEQPGGNSGVRRHPDGQLVPISEFGYIDDKPPIQARGPDRIIVGVFGGSVASFFAVNGTEPLRSELLKAPEFAGKQIVFLNLAVGGYKQPQQLMTLAYLLSLGAQFDLVINIDGFNEIALHELENASHHVFPAFPRSWQARIGTSDAVLGLARGRLLVIEEDRTDLARWHSRFPWRLSVLSNIVWGIRDRQLERKAFGILGGYNQSGTARGPYAVTGPPASFADRPALYEHLVMIWRNSSMLMNRLCRDEGMHYYHFLQPNQYVPGSKPMGDEEKQVAVMADHPYRRGAELGYPMLIRDGERLKKEGVAFTDLTGLFADHPEPIYSDTCCHYNQAGLELMARAIARAILSDRSSTSRERVPAP